MQQTLKAARKRRRLSVNKLAARAGVNRSTVSRIENGKVRPLYETMRALEDAMKLEPGTLKVQ